MWEIADAVEFITAVLRGFQPDIKMESVLPSVNPPKWGSLLWSVH